MGLIKEVIRTGIDYFDKRAIEKLRLKKNPIGELNTETTLDIQQPQYDISAHLAVYMINVYAYAAMRAIARDVAATDFLLQEKTIVDGETIYENVENTPLNKIFERPNPAEDFPDLIERVVLALLGAGDGYLIRDTLDNEFYYVKPDFVNIKTDASGNLKSFLIANAGITYNADIHELIHFKLANPSGEYFGLPPSEVIKDQILTKLALSGYIKGFFKNNALAGVTFSTEQELTPEQKKATKLELQKLLTTTSFGGSETNYFRSAVLDKGQSLDRLSHNMKDLVPKEVNDMIREDIGAAYGVPPAKMGLFGGMTFANADLMDKTYMRDTVRPIGRKIGKNITHQMLYFEDPALRLWWNELSVKVLQEDLMDKTKIVIDKKAAGIISTNTARLELGYEPDDDPAHDELKTASTAPAGPASDISLPANLSNGEDDTDDDDDADGEKKYFKWLADYTAKRFNYDTKDLEAARTRIKKTNEVKLVRVEKGFEKIIKKFWNDQIKRILANINELSVDGKINRLLIYGIISKGAVEDSNKIFDLLLENEKLAAAVKPYIKAVTKKSGTAGMREVGVVGVFNDSDPLVIAELKKTINQLVEINQTTFDKLVKLLQKDYAAGSTINQITKNIQSMYKDFSKARATTIARTEMNRVVSGAKLVGGIQAGATHKEWFATLDSETRPEHLEADGQIVKITEPFTVMGENLQYPGSPNGSAANTINCRCSHVNISIEE